MEDFNPQNAVFKQPGVTLRGAHVTQKGTIRADRIIQTKMISSPYLLRHFLYFLFAIVLDTIFERQRHSHGTST
jgi:hypothetical protein